MISSWSVSVSNSWKSQQSGREISRIEECRTRFMIICWLKKSKEKTWNECNEWLAQHFFSIYRRQYSPHFVWNIISAQMNRLQHLNKQPFHMIYNRNEERSPYCSVRHRQETALLCHQLHLIEDSASSVAVCRIKKSMRNLILEVHWPCFVLRNQRYVSLLLLVFYCFEDAKQ